MQMFTHVGIATSNIQWRTFVTELKEFTDKLEMLRTLLLTADYQEWNSLHFKVLE